MKVKITMMVLSVVVPTCLYHDFIINVSPSEPLGIYKIEREAHIQKGDIVAVCLPSNYQDLGLKQGYLLPGIRCDKSAPVIKTIVAVPGDTVVLRNDEIIVNGKASPFVTKLFDSRGRRLQKFSRGTYQNINTYWLIGTSSSDSWDSRYWGGVDRARILYPLRYFSWHVSSPWGWKSSSQNFRYLIFR